MQQDKKENRDALIHEASEALKNKYEDDHKDIIDFYRQRLEKVLKKEEDINSLWKTVQQEAQRKKNNATLPGADPPKRAQQTANASTKEQGIQKILEEIGRLSPIKFPTDKNHQNKLAQKTKEYEKRLEEEAKKNDPLRYDTAVKGLMLEEIQKRGEVNLGKFIQDNKLV